MSLEHWVWHGSAAPARLARGMLWGPSLAYRFAVWARAGAYRAGVLPTHRIDRPVIAVGNLTVGGTGKTPIASWIASFCATRGVRPAIVLRGYGGDEAAVHQHAVPGALVVEGRDRVAAARRAIQRGAEVVILDDAFQRLDIHRELNIVVVAAEAAAQDQRLLPAGPWRESWPALRRADCAIVTRKVASRSAAAAVGRQIRRAAGLRGVSLAHLGLDGFVGMRSGQPYGRNVVAGRRVLAVCGIAEPAAFTAQLRELGAHVQVRAWRDHHRYRWGDVWGVLSAARAVDYVVTTRKDAAKLFRFWPPEAAEPLVAELQVAFEDGRSFMEGAISDALKVTYGIPSASAR